ncbi:hypothetical protein IWW55_004896 [Coemansia sp. RSA 2706]|nr:hypothetical protein LPJ63_001080 [Coemansia sp. RSA 2711]KAJ1841903.1 hypothetical protein LPJ70_004040 [Coemansia sp. RSA 2708]KAJ2297122.1 hypothetical protein IWW55_004896 [Coemansia sp. RSA 2706]KAJ2306776.1 hypothetical protein IWW54_004631 [Coemansia sp. RSA 2705]KAJ2320991.1 hypothetical protein IWW52_001020 [Coemansia sp. RSA 2704]KAJ2321766.1 hypothetical protein IWW51_004344 [Coemansia sp. RSA 2702]KAJ2352169.1 hypothetical protein H4S02_013504 [Coemansia sp. RSA 2611]KAJ236090
MGSCCSRPPTDEAEAEQAGLLHAYAESAAEAAEPDRFANLSAAEVARIKEEEQLKALEQRTTEALINISHHAAFGEPAMGGSGHHARDYTEVLRRFNQQVRLPLVALAGGGGDVAGVLADAAVADADVRLLDAAIARVIDAISAVHIDAPPGDCVVPLSMASD